MSTQRKPLVGWTYDPELSPTDSHAIFDFNGDRILNASADELGIPAPRPPRTGTLGLSEEDTRHMADEFNPIEPAPFATDRQWNTCLAMHRGDVARWDAEDEAAANTEPETLWVEHDLGTVRHVANCGPAAATGAIARIASDLNTALENAGLS